MSRIAQIRQQLIDGVERVVLNTLANNAVLPADKSCVFREADPPAFAFRIL
jgi:hypothetical protein